MRSAVVSFDQVSAVNPSMVLHPMLDSGGYFLSKILVLRVIYITKMVKSRYGSYQAAESKCLFALRPSWFPNSVGAPTRVGTCSAPA